MAERRPSRHNRTEGLNTPLSDEEIDFLDSFLLDRIDEDIDTVEMDEGVLCVSELDGFLTAIVSSPSTVMPSLLLPAIWGDFAPEFESTEVAEHTLSLLMRHMNTIASHLIEEPETFEPLFLEREWDGKTTLVVDEWCEGYMRAVALAPSTWETSDRNLMSHLENIVAFCEVGGWTGHKAEHHTEIERRQLAIIPSVRAIHAYWLAHRQSDPAAARPQTPYQSTQPRIGRNDPCPCGSGKKYKKCCLH